MAIQKLNIVKNGYLWETQPFKCSGGDIRVRVHKEGLYPVEVLVSIDGDEEYLRHEDFGLDEYKCEITIEGAMPGQFVKFSSRSEITLLKILENSFSNG